MVRIGNFLFHYRNGLFPIVYLLLFFPARPIFPDDYLAVLIGLVVALSGQILRAVTIGLDYIIRGGKNRQVYAERLVQGGIFAHCRNPLYVGNFLIILGVGLASNSLLFLALAIPFFLFAYAAIIAAEEAFLQQKFGAEFSEYCGRVNRVIPNFSGFCKTREGMEFNWKRLIAKEYGSMFIWTAAIIAVTFKNLWRNGEYERHPFLIWILGFLFLLITIAYGVARYLKKKGLLQEESPLPPPVSAD
ncbi:MAG: isoprenylcysteine carboxylmethyltransferase family protein [Verrucomicrobiota bacterium]|nr:isoprenylcysteine carboxylmethyltransferase family protein [Verrucomicrobiota bacterium]